MKKICIFLLFCVIFAAAELINGVAIIVNNEPITLYEINKTAKEQVKFKAKPRALPFQLDKRQGFYVVLVKPL